MPRADRHPAPLRLLINGARGRMGAQIAALARRDPRAFSVVLERDLDHDQRPSGPRASEPRALDLDIDVVIDFSSDAGARDACRLALRAGAALLVGTTALAPATRRMLQRAARRIPVLIAPNTALGVAVLARLAAEAARLLGPDFDIDIIETHHARKRDAPSGTALRLAQAIRDAHPPASAGHPRLGAERIHALRAGDVVGEHAIHFAGPGERLTLTHSATSRELFARGALRAAGVLARHPRGMLSIEQALGFEPGSVTATSSPASNRRQKGRPASRR